GSFEGSSDFCLGQLSGACSHGQSSWFQWGLRPNVNNNEEAQPLSNLITNRSERAQLLFRIIRPCGGVVESPVNHFRPLKVQLLTGGTLPEADHIVELVVRQFLHSPWNSMTQVDTHFVHNLCRKRVEPAAR